MEFIGWYRKANRFAPYGYVVFIDRKEFQSFRNWCRRIHCNTSNTEIKELNKSLLSQTINFFDGALVRFTLVAKNTKRGVQIGINSIILL